MSENQALKQEPVNMPVLLAHPMAGAETDEIGFADAVLFFVRNWKMIFALGVLAAAGVAGAMRFTAPNLYESEVLLAMIEPPTNVAPTGGTGSFANNLLRILSSDAVRKETYKRLTADASFPPETSLTLNKNVFVELSPSAGRHETFLRLAVRNPDPERAAKIADMWAAVFIEEVEKFREDSVRTIQDTFAKILPEQEKELATLEASRLKRAHEFAKRYETLSTQWGAKIGATVEANAAEQGAFNAETMRLVGANLLEASAKISAVRLEKGYDGRKAVLDHWRARLGLPPHTGWNLSKVLSALADTQTDKADDTHFSASSGVNLRLKPAPGEVSTAAAHPSQPVSQRQAPVLTAEELKETTKNLETAAAALEAVEREMRAAEVECEQLLQLLLQQRQMTYAKLLDRQNRELRRMEIARDTEITALREEEYASTSMLASDIDSRKRQLMTASERVRDSMISTMPYVKSVVSAEPASDTVTQGNVKFVIMAAFGGLMLGAFIALVREIVRKAAVPAKS